MKRFLPVLAFAVLAGCTSQPSVTLPLLPAWVAPAGSATFTAGQVAAEVSRLRPGIPLNMADSRYSLVSKTWLDQYLTWEWNAAKITGVTYTPESFDCDDFAVLFSELANLAASRTGQHASPLIARLVVQYDSTERHELCGVATDQGIFVVEPQPDAGPFRATPLAQYDKPILSVTLGDYNPPPTTASRPSNVGTLSTVYLGARSPQPPPGSYFAVLTSADDEAMNVPLGRVVPAVRNPYLPDKALSPGVPDASVTVAELRSPEFIRESRHVSTSEKNQVYREYGIAVHRPGQYEVDHVIPKCLGGADDIKNLWPQPYSGLWNAHHKDRLEVALHKLVLSGAITLSEAQHEISADWVTAYTKMFPHDVIGGVPKSIGKQGEQYNPDEAQ